MMRSNKILRLALPVGAAVGALLVSLVLNGVFTRASPFLITSSPAETYSVRLTGQKERQTLPAIYQKVRFSVSKDERPFLEDRDLYSGDWFDPTFAMLFPQHTWVGEGVLHFYRQEYFDADAPERVVVVNRAGKEIKYLKVHSVDLFLLFCVQPGTTANLTVSPPRGDSRWVSVTGEFADGERVKGSSASFLLPNGGKGRFTYYISITDDSSTIESPGLEKY